MRFNDPELVRREYADEGRLAARRAVFTDLVQGANAEELAFEQVREARPRRLLEVGCGPGYFAARVRDELGIDVVALDLSPRMVELARARGVDARVGDVERLPFAARDFDCAVANWMLYHVPELDQALSELARVLRPGGRLIAATFGQGHLRELWRALDYEKGAALGFNRGNGEAALRRHFVRVERRDADAWAVFPDREAVRSYVAATIRGAHLADSVPDLPDGFRARSVQSVFIAEKQ